MIPEACATASTERARAVTFHAADLPTLLSRNALIGARMTVDRRGAVEAARLEYTAEEWVALGLRGNRDAFVASAVAACLTPILISSRHAPEDAISARVDPDGHGVLYLHGIEIGTLTVAEIEDDDDTAIAAALGVLAGSHA